MNLKMIILLSAVFFIILILASLFIYYFGSSYSYIKNINLDLPLYALGLILSSSRIIEAIMNKVKSTTNN